MNNVVDRAVNTFSSFTVINLNKRRFGYMCIYLFKSHRSTLAGFPNFELGHVVIKAVRHVDQSFI